MEQRSYGMLIVAALVALGAVGIALFTTNTTQINEGERVAVVDTTPSTTNADADGDGMPDWKEVLWGTDPFNPDTDGDGVSDGAEVDNGADPLREGSEPVAKTYSAPKALTQTESLSRELFVAYADARQDGVVSESEANASAAAALSANINTEHAATVYQISDLSVEPDVSVAAYELKLNTAFKKTLDVREYELTTFTRAAELEDFSELEKLVDAAAVYTDVVNDLLELEVPSSLGNTHLTMVNSLSGLAYATTLLTTWNGDPLNGLELVNTFAAAEADFSNAVSTLYAIIDNEK